MGSTRRLNNARRNRYAHGQTSGGVAILGANGRPTRLAFGTARMPGPLQQCVVFSPLQDENGQVIAPTVGGATRLEAVAAQLMAGAITQPRILDGMADLADRQRFTQNIVGLAVELIQECNRRAAEATQLPPDAETDADGATDAEGADENPAAEAQAGDEAASEPTVDEPAAPQSSIILP